MFRAIQAILLGAAVFLCCRWLARQLAPLTSEHTVLAGQWWFKLSLIASSLALWLFSRRPWADMGWRRPRSGGPLLRWYALAGLAMGLASCVLIWTGSRHPLVAALSFPEIVVTIWLLSSIAEEIFVRGLVQSWMTALSTQPAQSAGRLAVAVSAIFFAGMHVPLIWSGSGALGGSTIVMATLVLGWAAAEVRARTDSLTHAIGVHIFGNIAAVPFGILATLAFRLLYGRMPFAS